MTLRSGIQKAGAWVGLLFVSILLISSLGWGAAHAHHNGHEFETSEQCIQSGRGFDLPTCSRSGDGPWIARYPSQSAQGPGAGAFSGFIVFGLLWSAVPAVISGVVASGRGQSVGLAVLLGLVLGWIGLLIVVLAFKPEVVRATQNLIDTAGQPRPVRSGKSAAARLEELDGLRAKGLITDEEYNSRRQAVIKDI